MYGFWFAGNFIIYVCQYGGDAPRVYLCHVNRFMVTSEEEGGKTKRKCELLILCLLVYFSWQCVGTHLHSIASKWNYFTFVLPFFPYSHIKWICLLPISPTEFPVLRLVQNANGEQVQENTMNACYTFFSVCRPFTPTFIWKWIMTARSNIMAKIHMISRCSFRPCFIVLLHSTVCLFSMFIIPSIRRL